MEQQLLSCCISRSQMARKRALREALTFEKDIQGSRFLVLQWLFLHQTLHLYCSLRDLFLFPQNYINERIYLYLFSAHSRDRMGKNTLKDSTEAPCQMSFVISLPFNGRRLDTMFSKWAIKAASLVLQTEFLENDNKITFILERR